MSAILETRDQVIAALEPMLGSTTEVFTNGHNDFAYIYWVYDQTDAYGLRDYRSITVKVELTHLMVVPDGNCDHAINRKLRTSDSLIADLVNVVTPWAAWWPTPRTQQLEMFAGADA